MTEALLTPKMDDRSSSHSMATSRDVLLDTTSIPTFADTAVAVTGMACKFPGAESLEQFWDILATGSSQCRDLPKDRFPDWRFERREYSKTFKANVIDDVDAFDHKFFGVASREATYMDPQQRLGLQVVYQALESAGYFDRNASERERDVGCYLATCMNEYHENVACHPPTAFSLTGSIRPFISGKVSHHFGWTGPSIIYDTACAASGTAIHQACRAVATGECNGAVAGATNIFVSPDTFQNLVAGHFVNTTGQSKSFDAAADGYCRGEGVAFIVLKKLSAALRDGDPIMGVILATAVGQNANETNITVPHGPSQMALYRKALQLADLDSQHISYVEAHGTGTPKGDPIEANSIRGVFGKTSDHDHLKKTYLGSLKSNIGHTEAASGLSGLIKVLLMMQKGIIPRQALLNKLNPAIAPLEPDGLEIPMRNVPWTSDFKAACVNNYGASGTNAVMIVAQPPRVTSVSRDIPITTCPVVITAFSLSSLASYCSVLLNFIDRSIDSKTPTDLCYHLSRRKNLDLPYSICATVSSFQELKALLKSAVLEQSRPKENTKRPVVLFFGGQTGKATSVPRPLYDSCAILRKHLDDCEMALQSLGAPSIFPAIFEPRPHGDVLLAHATLFSLQYASAMAWLDCGVQPARLVGHSFGQYTALCVSGVLSLHDSLRLIIERARLIKENWGEDSGSMIAIEGDLSTLSNLLASHAGLGLEIACYNGPQSFVVAGHSSSVDTLETLLSSLPRSFRWRRLQITNAFHSVLTESLIGPLHDIAAQLCFHDVKLPLETCSKNGTWQSVTPDLVASHTREPVYFHRAVERISEQLGPCIWLEAGSGLASTLRRALGSQASSHNIKSFHLDSDSTLKPLAEVTAELWRLGLRVQFWPFHQSQQHQYTVLNIPPYQFDKSRHWLDWKGSVAPVVEVQRPAPEQTPLLKLVRRAEDGGEFQINTQDEAWKTSCSGYQVCETSVCPLSWLLELVSKAVDTIRHAIIQEPGVYNIQKLAIQCSIPAEIDGGLGLKIHSLEDLKTWEFEVGDLTNEGRAYISGIISARGGNPDTDFARYGRLLNTDQIEDISNHPEADSVKGRAVYRSLANLFRIPKSRQKVTEVSAKGNEAVGYLSLFSDSSFAAMEGFLQIPLLYLNGLRDRCDDEIHTITAMGQAKLEHSLDLSSKPNHPWAVYVKVFDPKDSETTCDIFVFDAQDKQLSIIMLDVTFTRVQIESPQQAPDATNMYSQKATVTYPQPTAAIPSLVRSCEKQHQDDPLGFKSSDTIEPCTSRAPDVCSSSEHHVRTQLEESPDLTEPLFDLLVRVADVDHNALRYDAQIADLGIDSLMGMEVAEEINKSFGVKLSMADMVTATDVDTLCKKIVSQTASFSYDAEGGSRTPSHISEVVGSSTRSPMTATPNTELSNDVEVAEMSKRSITDTDSSGEPPDAILKAFNVIREEFDVFAKATGCDKFWSQIYPIQASLIVAYITEAFTKLGCNLAMMKADEKVPNVRHSAKCTKLMTRLMCALRDEGIIMKAENGWVRTSKLVSVQPSSEKFEEILTRCPQFAPEHKLLHVIGSKLAECLTREANPLELLFGSPEKRQLMADQYLIAPIQSSASQQLGSFIKQCFGSMTKHRPLRILEIGGGTCGTSIYAVDAFAQLGIAIEYIFTDVSASFVAAAKLKLGKHKFVQFRTLDITKEQPELNESYDMIIATNVMHATADVCQSTRNARAMLRPGGFLTLIEYTCPLYLLDVIFGQLDGWWAFEDGREHAIMDTDGWKMTLQSAGFNKIDWTGGQSRESEILRIFLAY